MNVNHRKAAPPAAPFLFELYEVLENVRIRRLNQTTALTLAPFIGSRRALRVMSLGKRQARAQRRFGRPLPAADYLSRALI